MLHYRVKLQVGHICCLSFLNTDLSLGYNETEINMLLSISQLRTEEKYTVGLNTILRDCIKRSYPKISHSTRSTFAIFTGLAFANRLVKFIV